MNLDDAEDRDVAAGEYVMGTLAGDERDAFVAALARDAGLQQAVYAWQDRLLDLARRAAPVTPAPDLWGRIEQRLGLPAARAEAANESRWLPLRFWQAASGLALAASLVLATLLVLRGPAPVAAERYLAVLQAPDSKSTGWIVEVTAGERVRLVPVGTTPPTPPGRSMQFWTKPEGAAGPTSLGLVRVGETVELPASKLPGLGDRTLFELTLEPEAGSPIGRPTGPILFVGSTVRL